MKRSIVEFVGTVVAMGFLVGCQRPDKDVSSSPRYNFSTFAHSVWKTTVKVAICDVEQYSGRHVRTIFGPESYDAANPKFDPTHNIRAISVLPVGTHLRIGRLMEDQGSWGGVRVTAILGDGQEVNIDRTLLERNQFLFSQATSISTNWSGNLDVLEPVVGETK
jgi:hypothetical protein